MDTCSCASHGQLPFEALAGSNPGSAPNFRVGRDTPKIGLVRTSSSQSDERSPISSRKSVPPSTASNLPSRRCDAPVNPLGCKQLGPASDLPTQTRAMALIAACKLALCVPCAESAVAMATLGRRYDDFISPPCVSSRTITALTLSDHLLLAEHFRFGISLQTNCFFVARRLHSGVVLDWRVTGCWPGQSTCI